MKRILIIAVLLSAMFCAPMSAVNYCASSSWGYAGTNVTGGGSASPTLVTSVNELKSVIGGKTPKNKVVIITTSLTFTSMLTMQDASNITIMALPGVILKSDQQDATNSGILFIKRSSNIIIRNITFEGPGAYDCDGNDLLCFEKVTNAWVDHCDFQDGCDGNFDIKGTSDNITVTWCRFRYLKEPKAGGSGGSDDHRFSNLVGSGIEDMPADGIYNITYAFNWWDQGCKQRMTRCRNAELHFLNCYWNSSVADYYVGPEKASCYFEGCTFAGKANKPAGIWSPFETKIDGVKVLFPSYCTFVNCTGNLPENTETPVAAPTYDYEILTAATAKNMITNSSCGAGATLKVTTSAKVSSDCDGEVPPVDPQPAEGECCVDLSLGEEPTVGNEGIPEDFGQLSLIVNLAKGTWDPGYLNMGGNADYITFNFSNYQSTIESVEFDVTIPGWAETKNTIAYHWNSEANTTYLITSSAKQMVQLTAPANAKSFTIQRSASTSTRISGICFQIKESPTTDIESVQNSEFRCQKIIREGRLLILRDNKTYDVLGLSL